MYFNFILQVKIFRLLIHLFGINYYLKFSPTIFSSTLLELHIKLVKFHDCLYLLDGRFNQLRKFHVDIYRILLHR